MVSKITFVVLAVCLVAPILSYETGAPDGACHDMMPQHGTDAQNTPVPYNIQVNRKAIRSGDEIELTITGKTAKDTIRGFMIQARQGEKRIGTFRVDPKDPFIQPLDCSGEKSSAVTHKKHDNKDDKRSLTVTWVSPKNFKGEISFRSTIVLNGGVFWVGVPSDKVKVH